MAGMRRIILTLSVLLACKPYTLDPSGSASGFTDGERPSPPPSTTATPPGPPPVLSCLGDTQCPCSSGCAPDQICGPTLACTASCEGDSDCRSGVSGESCHGGLCAVPCDPNVDGGGCVEAGMPGGVCVTVSPGSHYCGYARD